LLVRFLVERFGWMKMAAFAAEYGKARGRLNSNDERRRLRLPRNTRVRPGTRDPRLPPDADAVRATFDRHFGEPWDRLRSEWEAGMEAAQPGPGQAERLVLAQRIYGAIRNYEMWLLEQRPEPSREMQALVRDAFTRANRALAAGSLEEGRRAFAEARGLVDQLRKPRSIARR